MSDNSFLYSEAFREFIHDDITWCANDCSYTECERNKANRLSKGGLCTMAYFKDTEMCLLNKEKDYEDN